MGNTTSVSLTLVTFAGAVLLAQTARLPLTEVPLKAGALTLGTVSSIASSDGLVYILQRGDQADPVIALRTDGTVVRSWGRGLFSQPHSIRIDPQGNIWTVDAGNSNVLKFSHTGELLQKIDVGEVATGSKCAFPGLCGTTDIAFGPNGRLFISDGYGNARVLEYSSDGRRVKVWGSSGTGPGQFQIPHGIAVLGSTLYVADRTNSRVQRFDLDGKYLGEWTHLGRPFALRIAPGALWIAGMNPTPVMLKVDANTGAVLGQIAATGPHAIDVSESGELYSVGCCGGTGITAFSWFH
jgi:DNA-binding beta-propeller fold protein YncE